MDGDQPPSRRRLAGSKRGGSPPFGGRDGPGWWRPPGYFSGPLLANPEFRKRFLARLEEICRTVFTEEKFFPVIDAMEKRLDPEVKLWAKIARQDPDAVLRAFRADMQSFRAQVANRRKFILAQLEGQGG
ncbi:MAG: CotH kinase family protein [Planctomycetes bacterium]|nr:CotH kinase family protein [Planctomycetota bacterium]